MGPLGPDDHDRYPDWAPGLATQAVPAGAGQHQVGPDKGIRQGNCRTGRRGGGGARPHTLNFLGGAWGPKIIMSN